MVGIDRHIRIGEIQFQPCASLPHIVQRLDERVARREPLARQLLIDPFEEQLDQWFAVCQPMRLPGFTGEFQFADLIFNGVQRLDLLQSLGRPGGLGLQGIEKATAAMGLILSSG